MFEGETEFPQAACSDDGRPAPAAGTLKETWLIEFEDGQDWYLYSATEWSDKAQAEEFADSLYGGEVRTRLVRVVHEAQPPREATRSRKP